jgi:hypothetical protein
VLREALPSTAGRVLAGVAAGALWMLLFGLITPRVPGYAWYTLVGAVLAWLAALLLVRLGDRGIAVGVAMAAGTGCALAVAVVLLRWLHGDWVLW